MAAATPSTTTSTPRTTITTVQTPTSQSTSAPSLSTVKANYFNNAYHNTFQKFGETTTRATPNKYAWNTKSTSSPRFSFSTKFAFHKSTTVSPYDWLYHKTKTPASRSVDVVKNPAPIITSTRSPYANIKPSTYKSVFDVYFNQIASYKKKNNL